MASDRWQALTARGARPQRPLWASTSVKDARYDDTRYVVDLVTAGVVNTMPEATMEAVAEHGDISGDTVKPRIGDARQVFADLAAVGIDMEDVFAVLLDEGVEKFVVAWVDLLDNLQRALDPA